LRGPTRQLKSPAEAGLAWALPMPTNVPTSRWVPELRIFAAVVVIHQNFYREYGDSRRVSHLHGPIRAFPEVTTVAAKQFACGFYGLFAGFLHAGENRPGLIRNLLTVCMWKKYRVIVPSRLIRRERGRVSQAPTPNLAPDDSGQVRE
jgi:hypothetical protein